MSILNIWTKFQTYWSLYLIFEYLKKMSLVYNDTRTKVLFKLMFNCG